MVPIPGTTSLEHLQDNVGAADVVVTSDVLTRAGALIHQGSIHGARYNPANQVEIDTEEF